MSPSPDAELPAIDAVDRHTSSSPSPAPGNCPAHDSSTSTLSPEAIFSPVPRSIRSMIDCRIVDHARTTARLKEAISWPLKPGPMRD